MAAIDDVAPGGEAAYLPSEAEIRAACAEIRAGWSRQEERHRRQWSVAPPVMLAEVDEAAIEAEAL